MAVTLSLNLGPAYTGKTLTGKVYTGSTLAGSPAVTESPASSGRYTGSFSASASTSYDWTFIDGSGYPWGGGSFLTDGSGNEVVLSGVTLAASQAFNNTGQTTDLPTSGGGGGAGTGDIAVNHNTNGTDNLRATTSGGSGIDGVDVYAYLTADYDSNPATATVQGHVRTGSDGRWVENMMLDAGNYTFQFVVAGREVVTQEETVS